MDQKSLVPQPNQAQGKQGRDDRIRGVFYGAACGSALGGSCVGLNHKEILATTGFSRLRDFAPGLSRSLLPDHKEGEYLSDVHMALTFADSLIENKGKFSAADFKNRLSRLLENEEFLQTKPGAHCLATLRRMADGRRPSEDPSEALHVSGVSRVYPAGCVPATADQIVSIAVDQAKLTHADGRVLAAAAVLSDSISYFVAGNRMDSESDVRNYVRREYEIATRLDERFAESWDDVAPDLDYNNPATGLPYSLVNIGENVEELLPTAVGIFLIFRHSLEDAICSAAVAGGDTDTLATMVGALAGAYHGVSAIPERWMDKVSGKDRLEQVARALSGLWS